MVAIELGGYFARVSFVKPRNPMRKFLRGALAMVGIVGLKRLTWLNATRFLGFAEWLTANNMYSVLGCSNVQSVGEVCIHFHVILVLLLCLIVASVAVKMHVHWTFHNLPTLRRLVSPSIHSHPGLLESLVC
jgi:hypothetical protein